MDESVTFNLNGMKNLFPRILFEDELQPAIERGKFLEFSIGATAELEILGQVPLHGVASTPRAAGGADERLAVESRYGVVVGEHAKEVTFRSVEPAGELFLVAKRFFVSVIAIEKRDSHDVIGNHFDRVEI